MFFIITIYLICFVCLIIRFCYNKKNSTIKSSQRIKMFGFLFERYRTGF